MFILDASFRVSGDGSPNRGLFCLCTVLQSDVVCFGPAGGLTMDWLRAEGSFGAGRMAGAGMSPGIVPTGEGAS